MQGSKEQQWMAQDALNRWWWPALMMFGPHDRDSPRSNNAIKWKIKRESNDALREKFINKTIPQAELIGLKVPDENVKIIGTNNFGENKYVHSDINWNEFWNVINGNGPCNQQRLTHHIKAHEDGAWVRDCATVFNQQQNN